MSKKFFLILTLILSLSLLSLSLAACQPGGEGTGSASESSDKSSADSSDKSSAESSEKFSENPSDASSDESSADSSDAPAKSAGQEAELQRFSRQDFAGFDTLTQIVGYAPDQATFQKESDWMVAQIKAYDELFSAFNPSEKGVNLYQVNAQAGQGPVKVDKDLFELIKLSLQLAEESGGAYNPAMNTVTSLWRQAMEDSRQHPDQAYLPDAEALAQAGDHIDYLQVKLDEAEQSVEILDPDLGLDLGGTAKGFALELVMDQMAARGLDHYLISMGGNVKALGFKAGGAEWKVGIRDPEDAQGIFDSLQIHDLSVVTSGIYERNFTVEGKTYHHLLDPKTLYPQDRYVSLTVLVEDSGLADGLSTALFNLDEEAGKKLADKYQAGIIWIYPDGSSDRYGLK